jgi:ribosome-associated protein
VDQLEITAELLIPLSEIEMRAVRSQGSGGQNVNKVATAIHLRFDIRNSASLPDEVRRKLLASGDQRISAEGVIVIKSQETRSRERNRQIALERLAEAIRPATRKPKRRIPTKPGKAATRKRLDEKLRRGELKKLRGKPTDA